MAIRQLRQLAESMQVNQASYLPKFHETLVTIVPEERLYIPKNNQVDTDEELIPREAEKLRILHVLMHWGKFAEVWKYLDNQYGTRLDSALASTIGESAIPLSALHEQLLTASQPRIQQLLILAIGKYPTGAEVTVGR